MRSSFSIRQKLGKIEETFTPSAFRDRISLKQM